MSAWVRLSRDDKPVLVGARSVHAGIRPGIDPARVLPDDWSLEWLVFSALKCDPAKAHARNIVERRPDSITPEDARREVLNPDTTVARIRDLYSECKRAGYDDVTVLNENGQEEALLALLGRTGAARAKARAALAEDDGWLDAIATVASDEDEKLVRAQMTESFAGTPDSDPRLMGLREELGEHVRQIAAAGEAEPDRPAARKLAAA